jgi:hypothetical protein
MIRHDLQKGQNRTKAVITDKTGHAICDFTSWLFALLKNSTPGMKHNRMIVTP